MSRDALELDSKNARQNAIARMGLPMLSLGPRVAALARTKGDSTKGDDDARTKNGRRRRRREKNIANESKNNKRFPSRMSFPDVFPDFTVSEVEPEESMEDVGRKGRSEEKIYVWKRGIALEEKKVPRENQAKIDALYPKKEKDKAPASFRDARDILRTYAKSREEEMLEPTSIMSKALLFATVFAYALGLVLTTHRGVVDLSPPAPIECEKSDAECTRETLPKRVEVFVSLD